MPVLTALLAAALSIPPGGRFVATLRFGGETWEIKGSGSEAIGPGPNRFGEPNAWVDEVGALHLRVVRTPGGWSCAEVRCARPLGYGAAKIVVATPFESLDPGAVLGFFTWSDDPAQSNREIDVEVSRWGRPAGPNLHFTTQPGATAAFQAESPTAGAEMTIDWRPDHARLRVTAPDGAILGERAFTRGVPTPGGDARLRLNLWLFRGKAPLNGRPVEVVLRDFSFVPLADDPVR